MKKILDEFAMSVKRQGETYDPDTNVISAQRNYSQLKEHVIALSKRNLDDPRINFFMERNPGWKMVSINYVLSERPTPTSLYKGHLRLSLAV